MLKSTPNAANEKVGQLLKQIKDQEKEIQNLKSKIAHQSSLDIAEEIQTIGEVKLLIKELEEIDATTRPMLDELKNRLGQAVIILFAKKDDKINIVSGVSKSLIGTVPSAVDLVKHLAEKAVEGLIWLKVGDHYL